MLPTVLLLAMVGAEFVPTNEWQEIPENVTIPGGLDVRLDMESGQRLAKLPDDEEQSRKILADTAQKPANAQVNKALVESVPIDPAALNWDKLEDLAHDIDHGEELMNEMFAPLFRTFLTSTNSTLRDNAGKVISISLRNNPAAARAVVNDDPGFVHKLLSQDPKDPSPRALTILSSFVSTDVGYAASRSELENLCRDLPSVNWTPETAAKLAKIVETIAPLAGGDVSQWVDSIQQALPGVHDDAVRLVLVKLLVRIQQHEGPFSDVPVQHVDRKFVSWLADQATRMHEKRDDATGTFLQLVKDVRHRVFGNPKASRVHFDDL